MDLKAVEGKATVQIWHVVFTVMQRWAEAGAGIVRWTAFWLCMEQNWGQVCHSHKWLPPKTHCVSVHPFFSLKHACWMIPRLQDKAPSTCLCSWSRPGAERIISITAWERRKNRGEMRREREERRGRLEGVVYVPISPLSSQSSEARGAQWECLKDTYKHNHLFTFLHLSSSTRLLRPVPPSPRQLITFSPVSHLTCLFHFSSTVWGDCVLRKGDRCMQTKLLCQKRAQGFVCHAECHVCSFETRSVEKWLSDFFN